MKCPPSVALWRAIADPFKVPPSIHRCRLDDWQLIDCDLAGCMVCGKIHACCPEVCPLAMSEGRQVCEITGFCVKHIQFADEEFVDTVGYIHAPYVPAHRSIEHEQIEAWIDEVLCSARSRSSLHADLEKRQARTRVVFLRVAKHYKSLRLPLNLVELCATTAHSMANIRSPRLMDPDWLGALARRCVEHAVFFCRTFLDALKCTPPAIKMHGFVVGLLYLMRGGMCICGNVVIVPRIADLEDVLPSENQVKALFNLSTKIITEVENIIKLALRQFTRDQLLAMGFEQQ
jgi:hypothetical protein